MPHEPYRTLDGSIITELVRPEAEGSQNLSVAEAVIDPGRATLRHFHRSSEEVYYVLAGEGVLLVAGRQIPVTAGQAHLIAPGVEHSIRCIGTAPLRILCLCAPAYQHEDTVVAQGVAT